MRVRSWVAGLFVFGATTCLLTAPASASGPVYTIPLINKHSDKCAAVPGGSRVIQTQLIQFTCEPSATDQYWDATFQGRDAYGNPEYTFENDKTGMCMEAAGGHGGPVWQNNCAGFSEAQLWSWDQGNRLHNLSTGECLAVPASQLGNGVKLIHYTCSGNADQVWGPKP
ncbi:RICIN domain-containing protein [Kribbella sp. NPDC026611]|uniref:RICIN domain-containing protein n=1 Tax=Kribbella sp. NPDC026611 TaxID=3154911 RepID=UPI0033E820CA